MVQPSRLVSGKLGKGKNSNKLMPTLEAKGLLYIRDFENFRRKPEMRLGDRQKINPAVCYNPQFSSSLLQFQKILIEHMQWSKEIPF